MNIEILERIKTEYAKGVCTIQISKEHNFTRGYLRHLMSKEKVKRPKICKKVVETNPEIISYITNLYKNKMPICEISNLIHRTERYVSRVLKNNKVKIERRINEKYTLTKTYFDKITTQEQAYILGLLYADGWNSTEKGMVGLQLQKRDEHILEEINKLIGSSKPLLQIKAKKPTHQDSVRLLICSNYISELLRQLGLVKNKSLVLTFPNWLKPDLYAGFIRGYIDGDGCILVKGVYGNRGRLSIEGNYNFLFKIQEILSKN